MHAFYESIDKFIFEIWIRSKTATVFDIIGEMRIQARASVQINACDKCVSSNVHVYSRGVMMRERKREEKILIL